MENNTQKYNLNGHKKKEKEKMENTIQMQNKNREMARQWFKENGYMPDPTKQYDLHHINPLWRYEDIDRYNQWNVEDLICMEHGQHMKLHSELRAADTSTNMSIRLSGTIWYTNGKVNKRVKPDEEIPEGFIEGRWDVYEWYTDGVNNAQVYIGEEIPEGYWKGKTVSQYKPTEHTVEWIEKSNKHYQRKELIKKIRDYYKEMMHKDTDKKEFYHRKWKHYSKKYREFKY